MSGDKLKTTKAEIVALDQQLAQADTRRKKLEREAAAKRAQTRTEDLEVRCCNMFSILKDYSCLGTASCPINSPLTQKNRLRS